MRTREAIILAGGLGTRLQTAVPDRPKPMALINGKPFLEYLLQYLSAEGIGRIIFSVGYRHEMIRDYFSFRYQGIELVYSVEDKPLGTGGGLCQALTYCTQDRVFVLNGDTFFPVCLSEMEVFFSDNQADLLIALHQVDDAARYGTIETDVEGRISRFREKNTFAMSRLINGGVYLMTTGLLDENEYPEIFSFEKDFLEKKTGNKRFFGMVSPAPFIDIGIPETYSKAELFFRELKTGNDRALFLDRDGTINIEKHYVFTKEDFEFRDGIFDLVKKYTGQEYLIFVVTNQAGIARGYYSENEYTELTEWMIGQFREKGIKIEAVRHCPHHPAVTGECKCRKPKPGMILDLIGEYRLNPEKCVLIGDHMTDIQAGQNAGIGTNYLIKETGKVTLENVIVYKS